MEQRLRFDTVAPNAMKAMFELEKYVRDSVEKGLLHLIKLRASFINGCAFCVDMHSTDALKAGDSPRKLFAVTAWRESTLFTRRERAALALTDAVTEIGKEGVSDAVWAEARTHWTERELADLVAAIVAINAWNRIAISMRTATPPEAAKNG